MLDPRPAERHDGASLIGRIDTALRARDVSGREIAFGLIALLALGLVLYVALRSPPAVVPSALGPAAAPRTAAALPAPPAIEPVILMPVDSRTATAMNAAVPFVTGPNPAALPTALALPEDDRQRAVDCLAAAAAYEAGDDAEGERAVAQVVLNRLRHPAFPRTVCGIVFQGSERATGCQFTFTCDGSIDRRPLSPPVWARAQAIARAALDGKVFAQVGLATHYHTDWVVPYWAATLDKLARVGPHLFYRWRGWWGTPPAFRAAEAGAEPIEPALAMLSDVHKPAETLAGLRVAAAIGRLTIRHEGGSFTVTLDKQVAPDTLPALARALCAGLDRCVMIGNGSGRPAFAYQHDVATAADLALFDCAEYPRPTPAECLTEPVLRAMRQTAAGLAAPPAGRPMDLPILPVGGPASSEVADVAPTGPPVPVDAPKPVAQGPGFEAIPTPRRVRHDPCAAMRSVAAADRVGPCAHTGF